MDEIKELKQKSKKHAEKAGIKLNSNEKIVNGVFKGLLKNKKKYGEIYCPCRVITGNKEKDKKIICPCIFHMNEIKLQGHCLCMLFVK